MPDFNKGDFTQQGVAGHVNANLRLNEKRLVNIDLTSNEEAEGCTIAGAVTDLLNNEVYPIGAGVSGNIEITENGENINVAPYATATVNVSGGGDIPLLTVTFITNDTVSLGDNTMTNRYDNGLLYIQQFELASGTTVAKYMGVEFAPNTVVRLILFADITVTDLVNCTYEESDDTYSFLITDPTQNSSVTITVNEV